MYPANLFNLFPPFPRDNKVFVAMSFDQKFTARWEEIIRPGIENVLINGVPLEAHRVDISKVSDSILTEILSEISSDRLIFADITVIGNLNGTPIRNSNVLYELGLAHAVRLPEEVLVFRSDNEPLLFDVANIRVTFYNPDNDPDEARKKVEGAIRVALTEIELQKHLAVRKATDSLDYPSWETLLKAHREEGIIHPPNRTMGDAVGNARLREAINRLLEMGAITSEYFTITEESLSNLHNLTNEEIIKYQITIFGEAILLEAARRMNLFSPKIREFLEQEIVPEYVNFSTEKKE